MDYYAENRRGVERITRFDILDLQHRLPRWMLQIPYDILNRMNRQQTPPGKHRADDLDPHGRLPHRNRWETVVSTCSTSR